MDNLPIPHINSHVAGIANQIPCLRIGVAYFLPDGTLGVGIAWDVNSKMGIYIAGKAAAVSPGIRVFPAPDIRVAYKIHSIIHNGTAAYPSAVTRIFIPAATSAACIGRTSAGAAYIGRTSAVAACIGRTSAGAACIGRTSAVAA